MSTCRQSCKKEPHHTPELAVSRYDPHEIAPAAGACCIGTIRAHVRAAKQKLSGETARLFVRRVKCNPGHPFPG